VIKFVGIGVGDGVGEQLVHSKLNQYSVPPATKPSANTVHISKPIGGV